MSENKESLFDKVKEDAFMSMVEGALPKIQPFIEPAMAKFSEWFGDDNKLVLIKKNVGQSPKVIILDNKNGEYEIKCGEEKKFTATPESVIGVYDIADFVGKMISGEFTKQIDEAVKK